MHISLLPTSTPLQAGPQQALLDANLGWLREELEGARLPEQKAAIRHEIGVLEQLAGRDSIAVRDLLAAVNSLASFKEPLERLIVLIERHRSFKNLPTLLEHLCRTADTAEESARAQVLLAWHAIMHAHDDARALACVEGALEAVPSDPAALLTLEILSRRLGDTARLRHAVGARLGAALDPSWASVLGVDLAASHAAAGEYDRANALLSSASTTDDEVGFLALERRALLGREAHQLDWLIEALGEQAARISGALGSATPLATLRVPAFDRHPVRAGGRLLVMAELQRQLGRDDDAMATLERASRIDPDSAAVAHALMHQAERVGRHLTAEALAMTEIEAAPTGREAAALWVRVAESRMSRNEPSLALEALRQASVVDPACWVARALELELLRGTRDAEGRARALEDIARLMSDSRAQGRHWLLAADAWGRSAHDAEAAQSMLANAERSGSPRMLIRRVERALAHASRDQIWHDAAIQRLLDTDLENQEKAGLGLELWRTATLANDPSEANRYRELVEGLPEGRLAARLAHAYDPISSTGDDDVALRSLAELESDATRAAALHWAAALRLLCTGARGEAVNLLTRVHTRDPEIATVAGTLSALLANEASGEGPAASVLRATAAALADDAFAGSLHIEAGLRSWHAGERAVAESDFQAAERRGAGCAWALSSWTRRASFDALSWRGDGGQIADPGERLLYTLECATRTTTPAVQHVNDIESALRALANDNPDSLVAAARLLTLVLGRSVGTRTGSAALERFAALGPDASRLADAWRYLECIGQPDPSPRVLEESTRKWSDTTGGLAAALEWLAATQRLAHRRRECDARCRLGELLSGPMQEACMASAELVLHVSQVATSALLVGVTPGLRLTNLETSPPGCDPRRRAAALDNVDELLGEEGDAITALLRGYNQLAAGENAAAAASFRRYSDAFPDHPSGWEGLLAAARDGEDPVLLAEATAALGNTSRIPKHAARLFEEAADIFFDRLKDDVAGVAALTRAVELDIERTSSFEKLFNLLRDTAPASDILALVDRRLPVATAREEILTLEWERARALRQEGDTAQALAALENVVASDPGHIGALALFGEIYITTQRYADAAEKLAELAARSDAPATQRLTSGLAAVDLFENQLGATARALQVLLILHRAGLSTLPVRERLARAAAKSGAWDDAVIVLEQLMFERNTPEERAEAARLALAIHRDRRHDPRSAGHAAEVLLTIVPYDAETLDLALSGSLDPQLTEKLLMIGRNALLRVTSLDPTQIDPLKRLARIADRLGDIQLRQATLGALVALGHGHSGNKTELLVLEQRISTIPPVALGDDVFAELADPEDTGPIPKLLSVVAPYIEKALGPTLSTFQVSKRTRISASSGLPIRNEIAAWVGAFQLRDFELYLSPVAAERVATLATDPVSVIIGSRVTSPLGPFQRQELARSLYALRRGLGVLAQLEETEVAAFIVALCSLAGVPLALPAYARQHDFERQLGRVLPRKVRRLLPDLAKPVREAETSVPAWVRAALASLDRAGAVAVGDASVIVTELSVSHRAQAAATAPSNERTRRLLSFVLSTQFESLRHRFGVSVR
jgi:tetratricopeptide (TPR) repeat protein